MNRAGDPKPFPPGPTRDAIRESIPPGPGDDAPEPRYLYVPTRHAQALALDRPLVLGIRGAGKSVWWSTLQDDSLRRVAATWFGNDALAQVNVSAGFGRNPASAKYPDADTLAKFVAEGVPPVQIWRAVIAHHACEEGQAPRNLGTWRERVQWVVANPEDVARLLEQRDVALRERGRRQLILFDTLERTARNWADVLKLLRGLLEVLLDLRGYRALHAKAFVRPDMLSDRSVMAFPEASKIKNGAVDLSWGREDLYGLLFQRLGNASHHGAAFRRECQQRAGGSWSEADGTYALPRDLRDDAVRQTSVFHAMAWKWMGPDQRRGFPYSWLPGHLADAGGEVSPRSFLAAVRVAAEETKSDYPYALYYEAIKKGVQEASQIRVAEVAEDFEWIRIVMRPLERLVVPCEFRDVRKAWQVAGVLDEFRSQVSPERLPPRQLDRNEEGLLDDLIELGLFSRMHDQRLNMPDVYRVAFGLGRKGGVKPVR